MVVAAACVFDTACWHTAYYDNTSLSARQSVILGYNTVVSPTLTAEVPLRLRLLVLLLLPPAASCCLLLALLLLLLLLLL